MALVDVVVVRTPPLPAPKTGWWKELRWAGLRVGNAGFGELHSALHAPWEYSLIRMTAKANLIHHDSAEGIL